MNVGDIVEYKKEDYLAIKVNEKSVYICKNRNFLTLWENRATGTKWKALCDREEAKKVSPDSLIVKEEGAVKVKPKKTKRKVVSAAAEKQLKECFERYKKQQAGKKTKAPFFVFETPSERVFPMVADIETNNILFHNLGADTYHFYNVEEEKFSAFIKEKHKPDKDILWPSLES